MSDPSPEYTRSPAFRLSRINASRRRLGMPPVASLDQVKLRKPMEAC